MPPEASWEENRKLVLHEIARLQGLLDKLYDRIDKHGDAIITNSTDHKHMLGKIDEIESFLNEQSAKVEDNTRDIENLKTKAYVFATIAAIAVTGIIEIVSSLLK